MEPLPPNVTNRLNALRGAFLALVYDPLGRTRVSLHFHPPGQIPLTVVADVVREARWPLLFYPTLRTTLRFASTVKDVRIALSKSFVSGGARQSVRVEVDLEGAPSLAFESEGVTIGPVPPPNAPPPVPARNNAMWS